MACFITATATNQTLQAADYKVGSRLPKAATSKTNAHEKYRALEWEDLLPKGWNLANAFESLNFDNLADDDPRAMQALEKLKKTWNEAPIEPTLNGKSVKISGFMIPLEHSDNGKISEFLLAPYFGACIHTPPPPANQLIHVIAQPSFTAESGNADVTVSGVLQTKKMDSDMGQSGYMLKADTVVPYTPPKKIQMFINRGGIEQRIPPRSR